MNDDKAAAPHSSSGVDPRLSSDGPTRWAAARATKTRCRNCYADIVQLRPDDFWRDIENECATCAPRVFHQPLSPVAPPKRR